MWRLQPCTASEPTSSLYCFQTGMPYSEGLLNHGAKPPSFSPTLAAHPAAAIRPIPKYLPVTHYGIVSSATVLMAISFLRYEWVPPPFPPVSLASAETYIAKNITHEPGSTGLVMRPGGASKPEVVSLSVAFCFVGVDVGRCAHWAIFHKAFDFSQSFQFVVCVKPSKSTELNRPLPRGRRSTTPYLFVVAVTLPMASVIVSVWHAPFGCCLLVEAQSCFWNLATQKISQIFFLPLSDSRRKTNRNLFSR